MEYVGRRVKKEFQDQGSFFGLVQAYEPETGFLKIVYDDGDSEEVELSEVVSLLLSSEPPPPQLPAPSARSAGRKPKKRHRIVNKGIGNDNSVIEGGVSENLVGVEVGYGDFGLNFNGTLDLNVVALNCIDGDDHGGKAIGSGAGLRGLDLNEAVNFEFSEKLYLDKGAGIAEISGGKNEIIDLNMDVNEGCEKSSDGREGRRFDLNLRMTEDEVRNLEVFEVEIREEGLSHHDINEVLINVDWAERSHVVNIESKEDTLMKNCASRVESENVAPISTQKKKRGRKRKEASVNNIVEVSTPALQIGNIKAEFKTREGTPLKNGDDSVDNITSPTPSTTLRRSSRRAKRDDLSDSDQVSNGTESDGIDHKLSFTAINEAYQENIAVFADRKSLDSVLLPPKVQLPPSSCNLDLIGVSVFDLVSVYAFLRSFSTLLFLSPFELDDFVASIKCDDSSLLFDSIHVSLLKTLGKHLESLSKEGSMSASDCLRSLNWDFLDLITWPLFVVEYLLLHSPGLDFCHLKNYQNDYYELPVSAKVEILRHLCDDVIEVEAFRLELNRRTLATEQHTDLTRDTKFERKLSSVDVASASCLTEEDADEPEDGNSDECCLCKMDGNLICCDGCPAAFHSRCVGVVSSLLPEGDWYCPECAIERDKPWMMRVGSSIRGAELLGSDPYGRQYYSSCGYVFVLESCNDEYSFCCYNRDDFPALIEALESSPFFYDIIINAICKHCNLVRGVGGTKKNLDTHSRSIQSVFPEKGQRPNTLLTPCKNEAFAEKKFDEITNSRNTELDNPEHATEVLEAANIESKIENYVVSSEGSTEVSQAFAKTDNLKEAGHDFSILNDCHIPEKLGGDHHVTSTTVNVEKGKNIGSQNRSYAPMVHYQTNYVNCYELARTALTVFEESTGKSSDKTSELLRKPLEEIIARQVKVVSSRFTEFSWSNIQNSNMNPKKERCGWCLYCRVPHDERDCLFVMNHIFPAVENFTCEVFGIQSRKNRKNHLLDIMCHIICIEDHLQGLLLGPWLDPNYSMLWRKSVLGVTNIVSLKYLLLKLELNLHHLVVSPDWRKPVDSVSTMGSASHIVSSSARASSKHGTSRKTAKSSEAGTSPSSNAATGLSLFWWRGGRGSRMLFSWKVLSRSLVSKAARQGGGKKIPGIIYPDSGEYAKRTKYDSWRAAVETSTSVEKLALLVRDLDANIKWDAIGNTNLIFKMNGESKKPVRSFKKVIIRKKCSEGSVVKYLLDFGKKRFIPDVVVKHGSKLDDSSNERKRYWLEESHVPLHILKSFEEKRAARKSNKMGSGKFNESSRVVRKPIKKKAFEYLFSRAERSVNYQCGHCKKDVLIREAVSCQHCEGFFHKRHVRMSAGSTMSACTYICHKCHCDEFVKVEAMKVKSQSPKLKIASKRLKSLCSRKGKKMAKIKGQVKFKNPKAVPLVVPLRRSSRNAARPAKLSFQKNIKVKKRKRKQAKSEKGSSKKPKNSSYKKKRTPVDSSYWFNGLRISRKPNDERLMHFRSRILLVLPEDSTSPRDKSKCTLCGELEHKADLIYVSCEICGVWLHVDALNLRAGEIEKIIGFKCHMCLHKRPPVCPHPRPIGNAKAELSSENKLDAAMENSNCVSKSNDSSTSAHQKPHSNDESKYS